MAPLKVLHLSAGNMYGGVETLLLTLARCRHLRPEMEPHFALCYEGRLSRELTAENVPLHFLGAVRASRPWTVRRSRDRLRRLLDHESFDAVISHMCWPHMIFGPVVLQRIRNLIYWAHSGNEGSHWTERWASRTKPAMVIANSDFVSQSSGELFSDVPTRVLYYPISPPEHDGLLRSRDTVRKEFGVSGSTTVIIQVSRMEPWKGHATHLQALARLKGLPDWVCWIVGGAQNPDERRYLAGLQSKARETGIGDRVVFMGQRTDVSSLLTAADIFCQPNLSPEPFGIVFVEALLAGLPVVGTAIGGVKEIVDSSCGILVSPNHSEELAMVLRGLIQDPQMRTHLGTQGPIRAGQLCDPRRQLTGLHAACATFSVRPAALAGAV